MPGVKSKHDRRRRSCGRRPRPGKHDQKSATLVDICDQEGKRASGLSFPAMPFLALGGDSDLTERKTQNPERRALWANRTRALQR